MSTCTCKAFDGGTLPNVINSRLPGLSIPAEIKAIAHAFAELQEKRHRADYDLSRRFARADVLTTIREAKQAIESFQTSKPSLEKQLFLICLWAGKALGQR